MPEIKCVKYINICIRSPFIRNATTLVVNEDHHKFSLMPDTHLWRTKNIVLKPAFSKVAIRSNHVHFTQNGKCSKHSLSWGDFHAGFAPHGWCDNALELSLIGEVETWESCHIKMHTSCVCRVCWIYIMKQVRTKGLWYTWPSSHERACSLRWVEHRHQTSWVIIVSKGLECCPHSVATWWFVTDLRNKEFRLIMKLDLRRKVGFAKEERNPLVFGSTTPALAHFTPEDANLTMECTLKIKRRKTGEDLVFDDGWDDNIADVQTEEPQRSESMKILGNSFWTRKLQLRTQPNLIPPKVDIWWTIICRLVSVTFYSVERVCAFEATLNALCEQLTHHHEMLLKPANVQNCNRKTRTWKICDMCI